MASRHRKVLNRKSGRYVSRRGKLGRSIVRSKKKSTKKRKLHRKSRKGPCPSATLFSVGTMKEGNDGNIWSIKKSRTGVKRWVKYGSCGVC